MYRSHNCGELRASHIDNEVTLSGWVQKTRDKGFMLWIDLRDRYGITQLVFDEERSPKALMEQAQNLGREFVIQVKGTVIERASKNPNIPTGDIEILVSELTILNESLLPPFTIEDDTDGGEELRMKYRYLDIRRNPVKNNLIFRAKVAQEVRNYLSQEGFIDIRFGMEFGELNTVAQHKEFGVFNSAELVVGIAVPGGNSYTRKEIDQLIDWMKRPQIGALGMIYSRYNEDGSHKSSVDKFYDQDDLAKWAEITGAKPGDLVCVLSGDAHKVRTQLSALRMELAGRLGLRDPKVFAPLWVVDFPLLEWDEDSKRFHAMHHPFTSPKPGQLELLKTDPGAVKANAYDLVLNGNEIGGGSIRIHDKNTQALMFDYLGFTPKQAQAQFGFLMDAFQYGAPPHGGLAFGLDRLVAILGGQETIRDFIAFPKNNSGRDVMIDAPAPIDDKQLEELSLRLHLKS